MDLCRSRLWVFCTQTGQHFTRQGQRCIPEEELTFLVGRKNAPALKSNEGSRYKQVFGYVQISQHLPTFSRMCRRNERGKLCLHSQINLPPVENCIWIVNTAASECEYWWYSLPHLSCKQLSKIFCTGKRHFFRGKPFNLLLWNSGWKEKCERESNTNRMPNVVNCD